MVSAQHNVSRGHVGLTGPACQAPEAGPTKSERKEEEEEGEKETRATIPPVPGRGKRPGLDGGWKKTERCMEGGEKETT